MSIINTQDILIKLKELKPAITVRYKAKEIGLFGSFARGEQNVNSDIDILVEFEEAADLFDLMGLALYLEEVLDRKVDIVSRRALKTELKQSILQEVIAL